MIQNQLKTQRLPAREFLSLVSPNVIEAYTPFSELKPGLKQIANQSSGLIYQFGGASGLYVHESRSLTDIYGCSSQGEEPFVMLSFFFKGDLTVIFDGYGERNFNQAEFSIIPCPKGMKKLDFVNGKITQSFVLLQITRDFITSRMGIDPAELPEPLRSIFMPEQFTFGLHSFPLTPSLMNAARAISAANCPPSYMNDQYYQSKATDLMCLIIRFLERRTQSGAQTSNLSLHLIHRLDNAQNYIHHNLMRALTLELLAGQVGLSKTSLVTGFRQYFGTSVFDYIKCERMKYGYELLCDGKHNVATIARKVGYSQPHSFSTAFRKYFGCAPTQIGANKGVV